MEAIAADTPDELIKLERSADAQRAKLAGLDGDEHNAQWEEWRTAATAFQVTVTKYAGRDDATIPQYQLEQTAKPAVRHAKEDPAGSLGSVRG